MKKISTLIILGSLALIPNISLAGFEIKEIMYDLEGSDTGREWIEVQNIGGNTEDLSSWKLVEAETSHNLSSIQGGTNIGASGVAVIADNSGQFLADHPGFSGILFDSSFSLSNTGETLSLKDPGGNVVDTITYSNSVANGDGNSLLRSGSLFVSHTPTPGVSESSQAQVVVPVNSNTSVSNVAIDSTNNSSLEKKYILRIGKDRSVSVGMPVVFESTIDDLTSLPEISWSFGDGGVGTGGSVRHTYKFPGKYVVTARATTGGVLISARILVEVYNNNLTITDFVHGAEGYVELMNNNKEEVNLYGMKLMSGGYVYDFPFDTIVPGNSSVRFPNSETGLRYFNDSAVLISSSGKFIQEYNNVVSSQGVLGTSTQNVTKPIKQSTNQNISMPKLQEKVQEISTQSIGTSSEEVIVIQNKNSHGTFWKVITVPERLINWLFDLFS